MGWLHRRITLMTFALFDRGQNVFKKPWPATPKRMFLLIPKNRREPTVRKFGPQLFGPFLDSCGLPKRCVNLGKGVMGARVAVGLAVSLCFLLSACGGGGSPSPPSLSVVTIAWDANRESGVNRAGGGYQVSISGKPTVDVPYTSGSAAPTSTTVSLAPGGYTVTVRAYAALDPQGGSAGNLSASSQVLTVNVP